MKQYNVQNLKPIRSHERAVEVGRRGGVASGAIRRQRKEFCKSMRVLMADFGITNRKAFEKSAQRFLGTGKNKGLVVNSGQSGQFISDSTEIKEEIMTTEPATDSVDNAPCLSEDDLDIIGRWNSIANRYGWKWALIDNLTDSQRVRFRQRIDSCSGGVDMFFNIITGAVSRSAFLRGQCGRVKGHEIWRPNFDFFLGATAFQNIRESAFDGNAPLFALTRPQQDAEAESVYSELLEDILEKDAELESKGEQK